MKLLAYKSTKYLIKNIIIIIISIKKKLTIYYMASRLGTT